MRLMVHLIAGFPTLAGFTEALKALRSGGAEILEIQIPFSDPTADGPDITQASEATLRAGFRVADVFTYIAAARAAGFERIMVMTYANIPYRYGLSRYIAAMRKAGVEGLIIPDLPLEDEEGFYRLARKQNIAAVPVAVVGMPEQRLKLLEPFAKIYVSLRSGITGSKTIISAETRSFLKKLSKGHELYGGFGISTAEQVKTLAPYVHAVVVGSYFTRAIQKAVAENQSISTAVHEALRKLF